MEITCRTIHSRYLLRPGSELNRTFAGVLARAVERHRVRLHAVIVMSSHYHLLISPESVQEMARFMCYLNTNLSKEIGRLHNWPGPMWQRRYTAIPVSDEPEAQIARLRYLLSNGVKEGAVQSPYSWPGIHSATALANNEPIMGMWTDRRGHWKALQKDQNASLSDFQEDLEIRLEPLPCWRHLSESAWCIWVREIIQQIEEDTKEMHRQNATRPMGARAVKRTHPHHRSTVEKRSFKPRFHASAKKILKTMEEAFGTFIAAYYEASKRLRRGDPQPRFPPDCFPTPLQHISAHL